MSSKDGASLLRVLLIMKGDNIRLISKWFVKSWAVIRRSYSMYQKLALVLKLDGLSVVLVWFK